MDGLRRRWFRWRWGRRMREMREDMWMEDGMTVKDRRWKWRRWTVEDGMGTWWQQWCWRWLGVV